MLLSESVLLLGERGKYFSDVYKLYEYQDDQLLKDYLDFVIHEPVEWMRGFPVKMVTKGSFSKPKSALIKLLKQSEVIAALGDEYCKKVYDVVWSTFKKHADEIIASRNKIRGAVSVLDQLEYNNGVNPSLVIEEEIEDDAESIHSIRLPRSAQKPQIHTEIDWEKKYRILEEAYKNLLTDMSHSPGLTQSALTLLNALSA
jgi:hypothetical protein